MLSGNRDPFTEEADSFLLLWFCVVTCWFLTMKTMSGSDRSQEVVMDGGGGVTLIAFLCQGVELMRSEKYRLVCVYVCVCVLEEHL